PRRSLFAGSTLLRPRVEWMRIAYQIVSSGRLEEKTFDGNRLLSPEKAAPMGAGDRIASDLLSLQRQIGSIDSRMSVGAHHRFNSPFARERPAGSSSPPRANPWRCWRNLPCPCRPLS